MKKKRLIIVGSILLAVVFALSGVIVLTTGAEEGEPSVTIAAQNVAFKDSVYLIYAVKADNVPAGAEEGMLFWLSPQEMYTIDNAAIKLTDSTAEEINMGAGKAWYDVYELNQLAARQMTDDVYAVAYIKNGNTVYYSAPVKYSILQYVHNIQKKGIADEKLLNLLSAMLDYGAAAQQYTGYKTDFLANAVVSQIAVEGGTLEDGFTKGLYPSGTEITLAASAEVDGQAFSYWKNSADEVVGAEATLTFTVGETDETYTAVYAPAVVFSEGLAFTSNNDGTCYVSGIGTCTDADIVIPPVSPNGDNVISIGERAFINDTNLKTIVIPESMTSIGGEVFWGCSNLESVVIGNSVTSIGARAFFGCYNMTDIAIPDSVTTIKTQAFAGCNSLTNICIPSNVTSIDSSSFGGCGNLARITVNPNNPVYHSENNCCIESATEKLIFGCNFSVIPDSVTGIGQMAFDGCTELIQTENGVSYVDKWVIDCDSSVTSVSLRNDTVGIGDAAFYYCRYLTDITIPDSVTIIGHSAFAGCSKLTSITIPNSVVNIEESVFYGCTSLTSITIPNSVINIEESAFNGCTSLTSITIPDSVTNIGSNAFYNCGFLTDIIIPESVTNIGINAFSGSADFAFYCEASEMPSGWDEWWNFYNYPVVWNYHPSEGLAFTSYGGGSCCVSGIGTCTDSDIVIPFKSPDGDTVTRIDSGAFLNNTNLTGVTIPFSVTYIGGFAFSGCSELISISIPNSVTAIGGYTFYACTELTSISIPQGLTSIGESNFFGSPNLTSITVDPNNTVYRSNDNCLIETATGTLIIGCKNSVIPEDVINIGHHAFNNCSDLTSITIPYGVTSIGNSAFSGCTGLTSISIPDSVTSIGNNAFEGCIGLTSITIPTSVTSISEYAFANCTAMTDITIPNSVTSIANSAFSYCTGLSTIIIPQSVTNIGQFTFSGCSNLAYVMIPDSVTNIGGSIFYGCNKLTIYCMAAEQPAEWDNNWNSSNRPVMWNYCPSEGLSFSFQSDGTCYVGGIGTCTDTDLIIPLFTQGGYYVTGISNYAFSSLSGLTSVTIPCSVTNIGYGAFQNCTALTSITIPESVNSIGGSAFSGCHSLTSITIPKDVTRVDDYTFDSCTNLTSITIPESVTSIGRSAFFSCTALTNLTIPYGVTSIGEDAFKSVANVVYYGSASGAPWGARAMKGYMENNLVYQDSSKTTLLACPSNATGIITIPESVQNIEKSAFINCTNLTSITIPDSVTRIGEWAFLNCTNLTIYCEAPSKLVEWDSTWNYSQCPVVWSYTDN